MFFRGFERPLPAEASKGPRSPHSDPLLPKEDLGHRVLCDGKDFKMMLLLIFLDAEDNGRSSWLKSKKKSSQSARGGGDFFFRVATKIKRNWIGRGFGIDCSSDVANSYFFLLETYLL